MQNHSSVNRRRFLRTSLRAALWGGAAGAVAEACWWEPGRLVVRKRTVTLAKLPASLSGFTLAHLTDLHRGPVVAAEQIGRAVALTNELQPDLVCLTGDYVSRSARYAQGCARLLGQLRAPHGVVASLGNHDHWTSADAVERALVQVGITVLRNSSQRLGPGRGLTVAAIDDVWMDKDDLPGALEEADPALPTLLLAHEPDFADTAAHHPVDLQLSGHSHGGQVWLPGVGAPILPPFGRKYPRGWYRVGEVQLYVNCGVGCVRPRMRLNCPGEVALIELRSTAK